MQGGLPKNISTPPPGHFLVEQHSWNYKVKLGFIEQLLNRIANEYIYIYIYFCSFLGKHAAQPFIYIDSIEVLPDNFKKEQTETMVYYSFNFAYCLLTVP